MNYKPPKSSLIISIILFIISAMFLFYGIYMISYSIEYVRTYMQISTISFQDGLQYVISSSAMYLGFAVIIFIGGFITLLLGKQGHNIVYEDDLPTNIDIETNLQTEEDEHPENNPYYTEPDLKEPLEDDPITPVTEEKHEPEHQENFSNSWIKDIFEKN